MAINTISYTNKSDINTTTTPVQNKVSATDMNEIKSVVNSNATLMGDLTTLTTTDKSSIVGAINEVCVMPNIVTNGSEVAMPYKVDNKQVYAKRFSASIYDGLTIPHGLTNFKLTHLEAMIDNQFDGYYRSLPMGIGSIYYVYQVDNTNIEYHQNYNLTGNIEVTLYYIKTS